MRREQIPELLRVGDEVDVHGFVEAPALVADGESDPDAPIDVRDCSRVATVTALSHMTAVVTYLGDGTIEEVDRMRITPREARVH